MAFDFAANLSQQVAEVLPPLLEVGHITSENKWESEAEIDEERSNSAPSAMSQAGYLATFVYLEGLYY